MLFLSQLLNKPVLDNQGKKLGRVYDLTFRLGEPFPQVTGLVVKIGQRKNVIPWEAVASLEVKHFLLVQPATDFVDCPALSVTTPLLAMDVMDSQVVDINGAHVVRVNDLQLNLLGQQLWVIGVDIGPWGLARRLGLASFLAWLNDRLPWKVSEGIVRWDLIDPMEKEISKVRLKVSHDRLIRLHPADLADIVEDLGHDQRFQLLSTMDDAQIADLIEESSPEMRSAILDELSYDRAADVLEEMEPDEAADLLYELPEQRARHLIGLMEQEEASEVRDLLAHEEGTVGALMTTSYLEVNGDWTVGKTIAWLRELRPSDEVYAYLYAVDEAGRLAGALSLRELIIAESTKRLAELFPPQLYLVHESDNCKEAAAIIAHYKLLAVPVINTAGVLVGVVSVHDAMSLRSPEEER
ncbi:MAG: PRC-barrel domain-containing protein [Cyanobacteria bacterium NC_groundwater_1444_Ag_S-0.65um_54_12]|nr:PRC-barrel domain-containing protein [Cyanobacteria bacterium NC_groundwater_1444_Ag_S-0.65um_54_12]